MIISVLPSRLGLGCRAGLGVGVPQNPWDAPWIVLLRHGHLLLAPHTTGRHGDVVQRLLQVVDLVVEVLHVIGELLVQLRHAVEDHKQPGGGALPLLFFSAAFLLPLLLLLLLLLLPAAPHPVGNAEDDEDEDEHQHIVEGKDEYQHLLRVFKQVHSTEVANAYWRISDECINCIF